MAAIILPRNFRNSGELNKSLPIEMRETPDGFTSKETFKSYQPDENVYIQAQLQVPSPSVLSLASRSYVDQSDRQPLTQVHTCSYGECMKYQSGQPREMEPENPMSSFKNAILYLVIALLILWIIIYTVLSQMKIL